MIADRAALLRGMSDEHEKPSRQNRRQKRGWQRKPKNSLDCACTQWQTVSPVLNTPRLAVSAPVSHSGFFTSIGFQWPGSAQLYNSLRAKTASRLSAVLKYLAALQQGVISTNRLGAIMATTITHGAGKRQSNITNLAVYGVLRHVFGPLLAWRLAFARVEVRHG
jgi:hypothetical protein